MKGIDLSRWYRVGLVVFWCGFLFKVMHWPLAAFLLIIGSSLPVWVTLIPFAGTSGASRTVQWARLAIATWHIYLLFRLQFWPTSFLVPVIAAAISMVALVRSIRLKHTLGSMGAVLAVVAVLGVFVTSQPPHRIFRQVNMLRMPPVPSPMVWDRYSWLLYLDKHYDEALVANDSAQAAVPHAVDPGPGLLDTLRVHQAHIVARDWHQFTWEAPHTHLR